MNITTIIPVHEYSEEVEKLLKEALDSLTKQEKIEDKVKVLVVYAASLHTNDDWMKFIGDPPKEWSDKIELIYQKNDGDTDFQSQVNFGVQNIETDWFTVLEFDDVFSKRFYYNAIKHIDKIGDDTSVFLPIMAEVNSDGALVKITNETVWSRQFVGENGKLGYLNSTSLNEYIDFKISSGAIIKKSDFITAGLLKKNIKLAFTYEFLLRMLNNGYNICSLPKILVKHLTDREGSLFRMYGETMNVVERRFWFNTAKKESNFFNDREVDTTLLNPSEIE